MLYHLVFDYIYNGRGGVVVDGRCSEVDSMEHDDVMVDFESPVLSDDGSMATRRQISPACDAHAASTFLHPSPQS